MHRCLALAAAPFALAAAACSSNTANSTPRTFSVTVENVSQPNTISSDRAMGTVPLSPGVYAVYSGSNPMFTAGQAADEGTESTLVEMVAGVSGSGVFQSPGGPDAGPAILAGESATFTITALPGDRLQIETMFVQSNDWFYAFGSGGLQLFDGSDPVSGDVTSDLVLYDAGTEEDTAPGTGDFQKPVQDPTATNIGPSESVSIQTAAARHPNFTIPATSSVIRVTVTPQ